MEQPFGEDADADEVVDVEGGMKTEEDVDDATQGPVPAVDCLVGGLEDWDEGVEGLEG